MQSNIINELNQRGEEISEEDIDELIPNLLDFYKPKLKSLAYHAYGPVLSSEDGPSVALRAFEEYAKAELKKGLHTFFFTSEHWRTGRDVNPYLITCLTRLADRLKNENLSQKKISVPTCPGCKTRGIREFLHYENRLLRCLLCTKEQNLIEEELKNQSNFTETVNTIKLEEKLKFYKHFSLHSRKGFRCPECERFIPNSSVTQYNISCIYEDCMFFGTSNELDPMIHPLGLSVERLISLNQPVYFSQDSSKSSEVQDQFQSDEVAADIKLSVFQKYEEEYFTIKTVIKAQMDRLLRNENHNKARLKLLMYQAYDNMLESTTEDMVAYLARGKHFSEYPIQSRIFQEYVKLIENNLPFTLLKSGKEIEICSLQDPKLNLFLGLSTYEAEVQDNFTIPNLTHETYTGKLKEFGRCFIGMLTDVIDLNTNKSIMNDVLSYTFVEVKINENSVKVGTPVRVSHFRIPSHYEMLGLVNLQRIRRQIVDSTYIKLHNKKRIVRKKGNNEKD